MNDSSVKESDTFDFIQGPLDNGCKNSHSDLFSTSFVSVQRELVKIRYRWNEADIAGDNELDIDEFLAFRHPEIAGNSYKYIVNELVFRLGLSPERLKFSKKSLSDRDEDQKLNETEFIVMPSTSRYSR